MTSAARPRIGRWLHRLADAIEELAWRIERPWATDVLRRRFR